MIALKFYTQVTLVTLCTDGLLQGCLLGTLSVTPGEVMKDHVITYRGEWSGAYLSERQGHQVVATLSALHQLQTIHHAML